MMRKFLVLSVMLTCLAYSGFAIKIKRTVFPDEISSGGEVIVSVTVEKEGIEGFARLIESVPEGFKAEELNSATGNFIFENGKVRIIWLTMPEGSSYRAEYKLIHTGVNSGSVPLKGKFHYVKDDKRIEFALPVFNVKVKKAEQVKIQPEVPVVAETTSDVSDTAEAIVTEVEATEETTSTDEPADIKTTEVEVVKETPVDANSGLFFKVQLGAYSSEKPQSTFGNLPDVHFIKIGNVYKYYAGKFTNEASARAIIPDAKAQGFTGAFLVRFKDGKRI